MGRWRCLIIVVGVAVAVFSFSRWGSVIERGFIYFPDRHLIADPADMGLAFEEVRLDTRDGVRLHGWFVPGDSEVTWLWFHGNAGNIGHRLENLRRLHDELQVGVFLFDYRGYGRSRGTPSEEGTYLDAEAALAYLRSRGDVDLDRIVYFGRSVGAAVAVELATRHPPYAVILESPFPSIQDMARRTYPFLPIGRFLRTRYDSMGKVGRLAAPLLVLHGDRDDVVPLEAGKKLFEGAREPKVFYTIRGAGHNDTYVAGGKEYFRVLREFVEDPGGVRD